MKKQKIVVVTGASYGLGKSLSGRFLLNGYKVYGISRTNPNINDNNFIWVNVDLLKSESFELIKNSISESKIDILINNAGVVFAEKSLDFTEETFNKTFGINLIAPIKLTSLLKQKLQGGVVVNISSTSDRFAEDGLGMYCSSKVAIDIYFDSVAIENKDIKVLTILPVYVDTPMLKDIAAKLGFTTDDAVDPLKVAEAIEKIITDQKLESGSRIMILTNKSMNERLYYYNIDTKEFKKVK